MVGEKSGKGITAKKDEFSEWFTQVMLKAELADYSKVSGCLVIRPTAYSMWEKVRDETDKGFKKIGVQNAYFPLLVPESLFNKEKEHVEGFSPEVAWVTETGDSKLSERLAIRPTSETIMYDSYSKWVRSWRDLPLRLNQWNNVVRWEFKHPVPFLRTREFLWNELHTVNCNEKDSLKEGAKVMKVYQDVCENQMALYGVYGRKTEKEKFAGAVFSEKLHYVLPNGKAIEGCCFHYDGQNFAKAYDIKFLDKDGKKKFAYQSTYAISTRMLGVMFAVHSDKKGLIMPPKMAPKKVVIVPILIKGKEKMVLDETIKLKEKLKKFDAFVDDREGQSPGHKFNEWEMKGIPIRIEIGPRDVEKKQVVLVRRDTLEKEDVKVDGLDKKIKEVLENIQKNLFERSKKMLLDKMVEAGSLEDLKSKIKEKKIVLISMKKGVKIEEDLKSKTGGAKTLWVDKKKVNGEKCVICGEDADYFVWVGKSY